MKLRDLTLRGGEAAAWPASWAHAATGTDETPAGLAARPGGYPAIAQIDPSTPEPEIVLTREYP